MNGFKRALSNSIQLIFFQKNENIKKLKLKSSDGSRHHHHQESRRRDSWSDRLKPPGKSAEPPGTFGIFVFWKKKRRGPAGGGGQLPFVPLLFFFSLAASTGCRVYRR